MNALGPRASARRDPWTPGSRAPAAGVPPSSRWLLGAVATLLASACDSGPSEPPTLESNVTVLAGAEVTTTDDAVVVGGVPRIHLGGGPRGMFVQQSTEYTYGGLYEQINEELVGESWYMDVGRRVVTRESGDTIFTRALDFGDVALEGTPASHFEIDTARVIDTGDGVRVYENLILNRVLIYVHRLNMDGSTVSFVHAPFYEHMLADGAIELTASGSEDIEPFSAALTLAEGARVTALSNGDDLYFERERQMLRTDEPLVVELSRPLDPSRAVLRLVYLPPPESDVDPETARRASAAFELMGRTDRVVIPASALAEVASHLPEEEGGFILRVSEYFVKEDVYRLVRVEDGTAETLSGLQVSHFTIYVGMSR